MTQLIDIGERRLIEEILKDYVTGDFGDDCAYIPHKNTGLVVTTDPVPIPAAKVIGGDCDPYWAGWLLVVINASDLAAAGAQPLGFLAALDLEKEMSVSNFRRLLSGIKDACRNEGLAYIGGNIRESHQFSATGTAIGSCSNKPPLRRVGARNESLLVSIGGAGNFWTDALRIRQQKPINKTKSPIFRPVSQLNVMHRLHDRGLIQAAMDNSDGLFPTLVSMAGANNLSIELNLEKLNGHKRTSLEAESLAIKPASRLWIGWGDWNIVAAISSNDLLETQSICNDFGTEAIEIGQFIGNGNDVWVCSGTKRVNAPRIESERFSRDSWFSAGIDSYIDLILGCELPV